MCLQEGMLPDRNVRGNTMHQFTVAESQPYHRVTCRSAVHCLMNRMRTTHKLESGSRIRKSAFHTTICHWPWLGWLYISGVSLAFPHKYNSICSSCK
jgi:hypothetical protein